MSDRTCTCPQCVTAPRCGVLQTPNTNWPKCVLAPDHEGEHLGYDWSEAGKSAYADMPPGEVRWLDEGDAGSLTPCCE
jgi:hypothetical protein